MKGPSPVSILDDIAVVMGELRRAERTVICAPGEETAIAAALADRPLVTVLPNPVCLPGTAYVIPTHLS